MALSAVFDHQPGHAGPSPAELVRSWGERDIFPRVVIDEQLNVLWLNHAAQKQLDRRLDLHLRDDRLHCVASAHHSEFLDFVAALGTAVTSWCFPCADGDGHLLFRAMEIGRDRDRRYFGVVFYRSGSEFRFKYADLDKVFQLTGAEHRVLNEMIAGNVADEIAQAMGVSIDTTRSHIRQIYQKLDVTSREGMFSRLRPYRLY